MHREINQRAREGAEGQGGEVVSPDLSYRAKWRDVSPRLLGKRDRTLLAHFYMKDFCEMIANLCKKAIRDSFIMHEQRDTSFATLFGLLDVILNAADEIWTLLPVPLWLHDCRGLDTHWEKEQREGINLQRARRTGGKNIHYYLTANSSRWEYLFLTALCIHLCHDLST